jgi:DNA modification methylase
MQQDSLLENTEIELQAGPVECLGQTFENDDARRTHYTGLLREKLNDPEFRKIEGFPIGTDEAILELSDPPYYTACPNPWLNDFVEYWESQKGNPEEEYHREPFAADVSEGKNDPIYNAHSYHTKVPHKAIMRYILHYTNPGDIVFDGFCGTGMTGVAAHLCGDKSVIESLGYRVDNAGNILEKITDLSESPPRWEKISVLGARRSILSDLSPAASFISANYNSLNDVINLELKANKILLEVRKELSWLYETKHSDGRAGVINYVVWSDIFSCPECSSEINFWEAALDKTTRKVVDDFPCPNCKSIVTKKKLEKIWINDFDASIHDHVKLSKQIPVLINYSVSGEVNRFDKVPDRLDIELIEKIEKYNFPYWFPTDYLPEGYNTKQPKNSHGICRSHQFFTKRNLAVLSAIFHKSDIPALRMIVTGILQISSKQSSFRYDSRNINNTAGGILKGTLYIPSISREGSVFENYKRRMRALISGLKSVSINQYNFCLGVNSMSEISLQSNSLDYLFIDPPFGANINYSELNTTWESWLKVWTNNEPEAIENPVQKKGTNEYRKIMYSCLQEAYRLLKPGRWLTVEFSNTKASVWNSIQSAISESGFIIANVSALDKQQGSFKAVTTTTAVKQDLVISAYKPDSGFETRFFDEINSDDGVWGFVRTHLSYLTIVKMANNEVTPIPERDPRILYDQLIKYYIRRNLQVPMSSQEFQSGLKSRFHERDGMYFLSEQVNAYDKKRALSNRVMQLSIFVDDEASAIEWMRQELKEKPKTYSEINPLFLNELSGWKKNELQLELATLLEQNFIKYDGKEDVPNQIHTYLSTNFKDMRSLAKDAPELIAKAKDRWYVPNPNKAGDIEKLRLRALMREFGTYKEEKKKIKQPRIEALRAGFNSCWANKDLQTILDIAAKIPPAVLQEDEKLLMFYDNALTLTSNQDDDWD